MSEISEGNPTMLFFLLFTSLVAFANADSTLVARPPDFKANCYLSPAGVQTAKNKEKLNAEIQQKFGAFKDNCFPKPSGGCKCNVDEGQGEVVKDFSDEKDCKKSLEVQTAENKKKLNEEIKEKFGGFKENCFPKPSGGCKCNEKDDQGNEVVATYNDVNKCQAPSRARRQTRGYSPTPEPPSQNVRDPVREKAQANYAAVLDELRNKFKGLKEGCFPRPKVGKTPEGRDITERRMKDVDCKCQPGETGNGCPAA